MVRGGLLLIPFLVGACGVSVRHAPGAAGASGAAPTLPPDDPQAFGDPPANVCTCTADEAPACCTTHSPDDFGGCSCGNGAVDACTTSNDAPPDECDGKDLGGQSCASLGYASGALGCSYTCHFDVSGCEDCVVGSAVAACLHPLDDHNDVQMLALGTNGTELGLATVTGTSTELGYSGDTSVRLALLDASLNVTSSVAVPLRYASSLSLAATADGWLLLVESLNYVGFDAPPDGVLHTLLSFDRAGQPRGSAVFHERRDGFLVPRAGGEPLYVFASDYGGTPKVWGQIMSYGGADDVAPFMISPFIFNGKSAAGESVVELVPGCGVAADEGFLIASRYALANGREGFENHGVLVDPKILEGGAFYATEPGSCAFDDIEDYYHLIYQAESPDDPGLATFRDFPPSADLLVTETGPVPRYRVVGYPNDVTIVLRAVEDLELLTVSVGGQVTSTDVLAHGSRASSYDMLRFGDKTIAAWVGKRTGTSNAWYGRVTLARLEEPRP